MSDTLKLEETLRKNALDKQKIENLPKPISEHIGEKYWRYVGASTLGMILAYDFTTRLLSKRRRLYLFTSLWVVTQIYLIRHFGKVYPLRLIHDARKREDLEEFIKASNLYEGQNLNPSNTNKKYN